MAEKLVSGDRCTARTVCRHLGLNRSTYTYRAKEAGAWEAKLKEALRRKSNEHPELGYAKITRLLKQEGWQVGARNVQRLRRELGLAVPAKKPKRRRQGVSTGLPTKGKHRGHVWTWDFVHDTTKRGGKLRTFNIIDEYTRECLCIHVDRQINARKVKKIFSKLIDEHGAPKHIRSDNGSEFIEKGLREWLAENELKTLYIEAGSPWQNGYILTYYLRKGAATATSFSAVADGDGDSYLVTVAAATTAGYAAGMYDFISIYPTSRQIILNHVVIAGFRLNPSTWSRDSSPLSCAQGRASSAQSRGQPRRS